MQGESTSPPFRTEGGFSVLRRALGSGAEHPRHRAARFAPVQQVADEKTCMQFSIRRPKLLSSETHPEESAYRRLDVSSWLQHLNQLGQVEEEYKLRKVRPPSLPGPALRREPCKHADKAIGAPAWREKPPEGVGSGVPRQPALKSHGEMQRLQNGD